MTAGVVAGTGAGMGPDGYDLRIREVEARGRPHLALTGRPDPWFEAGQS
jgi:hypothetical protein